MKITKIGWMGKTEKPVFYVGFSESLEIDKLFRTKGKREQWNKEDWPPRKVRITIETIE